MLSESALGSGFREHTFRGAAHPVRPARVQHVVASAEVSAATLVEDKKQALQKCTSACREARQPVPPCVEDGAANGKLDAKVASDNGIDVHDVHEDHPPKEEGAEKAGGTCIQRISADR